MGEKEKEESALPLNKSTSQAIVLRYRLAKGLNVFRRLWNNPPCAHATVASVGLHYNKSELELKVLRSVDSL